MSTAADMLKPLPDVIEPRWSPGKEVLPRDSYVIDGGDYAIDEPGEERELGVLIGDAYQRIGDLDGKW